MVCGYGLPWRVCAVGCNREDAYESSRVDLHPTLVGNVQADFQLMPSARAAFEHVPSIIFQPKSAWTILFGVVWRKPLEILQGEGERTQR